MPDVVRSEANKLESLEVKLRGAEDLQDAKGIAKARAALQDEVNIVNHQGKDYASSVYNQVVDDEMHLPGTLVHLPAIRLNGDHLEILPDSDIRRNWNDDLKRQEIASSPNQPAPAEQGPMVDAGTAAAHSTSNNSVDGPRRPAIPKDAALYDHFGLSYDAPEKTVKELKAEEDRLKLLETEMEAAIRGKKDLTPYIGLLQAELEFIDKRPSFAAHLAKGLNKDLGETSVEYIPGRGLVIRDWDSILRNANSTVVNPDGQGAAVP